MPLAALWGDGTTSSSDGQQFHAGGRGAAIGDINARSGNEPGVAFYTHVSDRYDPFASRVIAATASRVVISQTVANAHRAKAAALANAAAAPPGGGDFGLDRS